MFVENKVNGSVVWIDFTCFNCLFYVLVEDGVGCSTTLSGMQHLPEREKE
jgi:hypothetical protein